MSILGALAALMHGIDGYALHGGVFACIASCMRVDPYISFVAYQSNRYTTEARQINLSSSLRHDHLSAHTLSITVSLILP